MKDVLKKWWLHICEIAFTKARLYDQEYCFCPQPLQAFSLLKSHKIKLKNFPANFDIQFFDFQLVSCRMYVKEKIGSMLSRSLKNICSESKVFFVVGSLHVHSFLPFYSHCSRCLWFIWVFKQKIFICSGKKRKPRRKRPPSSSVATDEEGVPHLKSYRKLKSPKTASSTSTRVWFVFFVFLLIINFIAGAP